MGCTMAALGGLFAAGATTAAAAGTGAIAEGASAAATGAGAIAEGAAAAGLGTLGEAGAAAAGAGAGAAGASGIAGLMSELGTGVQDGLETGIFGDGSILARNIGGGVDWTRTLTGAASRFARRKLEAWVDKKLDSAIG